jgi:glycogen debranching enzyme
MAMTLRPYPPPSVSVADPSFSLSDSSPIPRNHRYWRGPTWINSAWLLWLGLVRLGYDERASELAARVGAMVAASGLREYYNPYTGDGMGQAGFAWSTLAFELLEPDPRAAASYISTP